MHLELYNEPVTVVIAIAMQERSEIGCRPAIDRDSLEPVDRMQRRFFREIGLLEIEAFRDFNLAPLDIRRDIILLRMINNATKATPTRNSELYSPAPNL